MFEVIKSLLDRDKYSIFEYEGYIEIYKYLEHLNMEDPEVFVQLEFSNNIYSIYKVSRELKSLEMKSEDKIYFVAYAYFYIDKLFSDKSYIFIPRSEVNLLLLEDEIEEARKLLINNLNFEYASINKIEKNKISLVKREKDSAVIYNGKIMEENIKFSEGFGTLFTFSKYLERFEELFNKLKESLPVDKYYDKLLNFI